MTDEAWQLWVVGKTSQHAAALEQLVFAVRLYDEEKYIPAITLAGAAEHILAELVKVRSNGAKENSLTYLKRTMSERDSLGPDAARKLNDTRNWLKHPDPKAGPEGSFEENAQLCLYAGAMICRALQNLYASSEGQGAEVLTTWRRIMEKAEAHMETLDRMHELAARLRAQRQRTAE